MVSLSGKNEGIFALYQIGVCHIPASHHGEKQGGAFGRCGQSVF
jgi:hypothetical protein